MACSLWGSPQRNHIKCFLLRAMMDGDCGFSDVTPLILGQYVNALRYQETHVKLDELRTFSGCQPGEMVALVEQRCCIYEDLLAEMLDGRLLYDSDITHSCLFDLMIPLYRSGRKVNSVFLAARDNLLAIAAHFKYVDVILLHTHLFSYCESPSQRSVVDKYCALLLDYLYTISAPEFYVVTSIEKHELRTATLFRRIISSLLRQACYKEAASACHYVILFAGIQNPWVHLQGIKKDLFTEYKEMLLHFNTMSKDNTHDATTWHK